MHDNYLTVAWYVELAWPKFLLSVACNDYWLHAHPLAADSHATSSPCNPSPCGQYSLCQETGDSARCSCLLGYMGSPPRCGPECVTNSECPTQEACVNLKCTDPCLRACGVDSECRVIHHNPVCTCRPQYTGDPLAICLSSPERKHHPCSSISLMTVLWGLEVWHN